LSRIGLDPALYSTLGSSACGSFFQSIFFKSRSSASFSSALNDFAGPLDFLKTPILDHTLNGDTLSCKNPIGTLNISNNTTAGYYSWKAINGGNLINSNLDSTTLTINKSGSYIVQA